MAPRKPITIDQTVAATIDDVQASAKAQGFIPEQQEEASWELRTDDIAHIPDFHTLSDAELADAESKYGRYHYHKAMLRDFAAEMPADVRLAFVNIVKMYEVHGEALVENTYRAALLAALAGGAATISAVGVAASTFVIGLTGSVTIANMAVVSLIFAAAFAVFKYGDELLAVLRWISDRVAMALDTVCDWVAAGWKWLNEMIAGLTKPGAQPAK